MNQKEFWKDMWLSIKREKSSNFSRRYLDYIKPKGKTILDLGSGDGKDSLFFASCGMIVTSVDFSESGIAKLKEEVSKKGLKNIKVIKKDLRKINFDENSFDLIYAHLSLHYFNEKDTKKIFDKLYKVLKSGGMIFIKCKSVNDALYGIGEKIEEDMFIKDGQIRHFFSKAYMKEKLEKFDVIRIRKASSVYADYKSNFIEAIAKKR